MRNEGFYYDYKNWTIEVNPKNKEGKVHVSTIFVLILAPLLGALLVVALPLIGFALLGKLMIQKGVNAIQHLNKKYGSVNL